MFLFMVVALVAAIGAAACGGDEDEAAAPAGMADTMTMEKGSGEVGVVSPAADLRVTLDQLLGEHAVLAMLATQKGFSGDADFKQISAALDANSVELSEAIASVYGEEAGEKFLNGRGLWRDHIQFFVAYTVGLAKDDPAAQKQAVANLKGYIAAFSTFLSEATGLPQDALQDSITQHVDQLKGQIDAYAAGDYDEAYRIAREAYAHMYMTGDTLAAAIVEQSPDKFTTDGTTAAAVDLRVTLDRLLGEHALLAQFATQKGFSGDADFKQISAALDANSVELSEAIASVYGEEAGEKFLNGRGLWRDHIQFFVAYTVGLAKDDPAAQKQAVANLKGYIAAFSTFLSEATGLPQDALQDSITQHVDQLKGQIDGYAGKDYADSYELLRTAYDHMIMTGDTLAGGIVAQSPEKFASS